MTSLEHTNGHGPKDPFLLVNPWSEVGDSKGREKAEIYLLRKTSLGEKTRKKREEMQQKIDSVAKAKGVKSPQIMVSRMYS